MRTTSVLVVALALVALSSVGEAKRQGGASATKAPAGKPSKTSFAKGGRGWNKGQSGQASGWSKGQKKEETAEATPAEESQPTEPQTKKTKGAQWNAAQKKGAANGKPGKTYVLEKAGKPSLYTRAKPAKEMKVVEVAAEEASVEVAEEEEETEEPTTTLVLVKEAESEAPAVEASASESLLPSSVAAELAALRAELAAERELERLRASLDSRKQRAADKAARKAAWTAANPAAARPPKAKKCLDIHFTGAATIEEDSASGAQATPALQRCSCSCRPAAVPATNETTAAEPSLAQKVIGAVADLVAQDDAAPATNANDNASLDQI